MRRLLIGTVLAAALTLTASPAAWACGEVRTSPAVTPPASEETGSPDETPLALAAGGGGLLVLGGATLLVLRRSGGGMA